MAAPDRKPMGDVVVLLPGITGSVLQRDGKDAWALSGGAILRGVLTGGGSLRELALEDDPPDKDDLGDGVTADRLIDDVHVVPGLWRIDGYTSLRVAVEQAFEVTLGRNLFTFPYDWRRDNRVAGRRLARAAERWLHDWRTAPDGDPQAKLVLIAHSMGGLVSRYFLECLEGWRETRTLITFGTPYRGSLNSLDSLANGFSKGIGPLKADLSPLLRSFTSVYQLLPIYPCCAAAGGSLARVSEISIPHVDRGKAEAALGFHWEIRDAVKRHLGEDSYLQGRYAIRPVVASEHPTHQSATISGDGVELVRAYENEDQGGDGTVPRVSATPIELDDEPSPGAVYAPERHGSLQNDKGVLRQVVGILSEPRLGLQRFRSLTVIPLGLDIGDFYPAGEPIPFEVQPAETPPQPLNAYVYSVVDGQQLVTQPLRKQPDGRYGGELPPLAAGAYRLRVEGGSLVAAATEVFLVGDTG
jgi:Lecithin:cholesterol acyltransferase